MNYYQKGIVLNKDMMISGWVATPGVIRDEINQLSAEITSVDKQMILKLFQEEDPWGFHTPKPSADKSQLDWYYAVWRPFHTDWLKFENAHKSFFGNLWGSSWDQIQEYRKWFIKLYQMGNNIGMNYVGPSPTAPREGAITTAGKEAWGLVKTIIYAVIAIVGGWILIELIKSGGGMMKTVKIRR